MNKEYGIKEVIHTTTKSGQPDQGVRSGEIKPGRIIGGPEKAGVTSVGIFMDAAGPREPRITNNDTKLEMNIPSALL